ncbi:MAG: EamA family transporter [Methanomicrobiales archaeon]
MHWVVLTLAGAWLDALYYAAIKRFVTAGEIPLLSAGSLLWAAVLLGGFSLLRGLPDPGPLLLPAAAISGVINAAAALLYYHALSRTDLSLAQPMLCYTPLFLVVTSYLILGEFPSLAGLVGIGLVVSGSYILASPGRRDAGEMEGGGRRSGVILMLIVAVLFSIAANMDKLVVLNSDTSSGTTLILLIAGAVILTAWGIRPPGRSGEPTIRVPPVLPLVIIGSALALAVVLINTALQLAIVPYVISLKRTSILFAILIGGGLFHEPHMGRRLLAGGLMVAGVSVLYLVG